MLEASEVEDYEMIVKTIEYLENLIIPSKDLIFIFIAVRYLRQYIGE
ncbi:hypothetical protein [Clostridium grantii]|uniref:Uncharacterized protein n=1 Tax=Clostridium grantii DSM 8605 TaxID=1121316 RepID=A0A1M5U798_9CLOT|nr:hypothetical protein [Clostridium grantii]SHH58922.1 hypothetical protein SAMN02745207_01622 [Clostridium grantii DSM 8605]